ncbi:hypothetical protein KIN20_017711 [Parelaphostrongylus tenuis]|uniref:Uncharacterized protein n=1 Tax=Parelaphostrongylus tenuis TaxID=148309 RepID=A0AAD5N6N0_PARTN|nr:hypothetical protein KIN20_017711 [Parelaphostrongylus tenuis]
MADIIVRQLCVEFRKKRVLSAKAAETLVENANIHEKLQKSKFEKYHDGEFPRVLHIPFIFNHSSVAD